MTINLNDLLSFHFRHFVSQTIEQIILMANQFFDANEHFEIINGLHS